jgi:hypothetical protein
MTFQTIFYKQLLFLLLVLRAPPTSFLSFIFNKLTLQTEHKKFITQLSYIFTRISQEWEQTISITVGSISHLRSINFEKSITTAYKTFHPYESTLHT